LKTIKTHFDIYFFAYKPIDYTIHNRRLEATCRHLRVITPDGRIYDYAVLKNEILVGRGRENDLVLKDDTISRIHARIAHTREGYQLSDQEAFNGIKVNENPIQSVVLKRP